MGSITDDRLIYGGLDANTMQPRDRGDPRRTPLPLLTGEGVTGSPAGVAISDGRYLKVGDRVRVEVDGLGALDNTVVAEPVERAATATTGDADSRAA
jgi:hypothetical protein